MSTVTVHEAAAEFARDMALAWEKDCGRLGEAHDNFEVRVWDGRVIVLRALTSNSNGWHRVQQIRRGGVARYQYPVRSVFSTRDSDFVADMWAAQ